MSQDNMQIKLNSRGLESKIKVDSSYINYYIIDFKDTIWFTEYSEVVKCDFTAKLDKSHNNCTFYSNKKEMNGFFTICTINNDITQIYKGTMKNGNYENGTVSRYFENGIIQMIGQYQDNWKIGFWTTYHNNGRLDSIMKFIEGANDPVVEIEYDENGKIINSIDEEDDILKIINVH